MRLPWSWRPTLAGLRGERNGRHRSSTRDEVRSVVEEQTHDGPAVASARFRPVRLPPDQITRQAQVAMLRLGDLLVRRGLHGKFQRRPIIRHQDIYDEFIKAKVEPDRPR